MEIASAVRSPNPEQFVSRIPVHQVPIWLNMVTLCDMRIKDMCGCRSSVTCQVSCIVLCCPAWRCWLHHSNTDVDVVYCYTPSSMICWSVGQSVTIASRAKMAEPIEMPFGLWTRVGPRNHVLDGVHIPTKAQILGERTCQMTFHSSWQQMCSPAAGAVVALSPMGNERIRRRKGWQV